MLYLEICFLVHAEVIVHYNFFRSKTGMNEMSNILTLVSAIALVTNGKYSLSMLLGLAVQRFIVADIEAADCNTKSQ